ncbi:MAG: cytochrome c3 family protein [Deltaproteobacteria bacterium]|nr:cytochrome c3 family protein [Deltaproteobacteria bacterium]
MKQKGMGLGRITLILLGLMFIGIFMASSPTLSKEGDSFCVKCHLDLGGEFAKPVRELQESVHFEKDVACHDCHGGDPTSFDEDKAMSRDAGFVAKPKFEEIPEFCARCHSDANLMKKYNLRTDQLSLYKTSFHGKAFYEKKDKNTATCVSCHGGHDMKAAGNPHSDVYKANIPRTCNRCHGDPVLMRSYGIPSDQFEQFRKSIHGKLLLEKMDLRAPACTDCHGVHGAHPPGYKEIADVCSHCHGAVAKLFRESPHYMEREKVEVAKCVDCHGDHDIVFPSTVLYGGEEEGRCGGCHGADSKQDRLATIIQRKIRDATASVESARKSLESVRGSGKNIASIEENFETARSELVKARTVTHTLSIEKIEEHTNEAQEKSRFVLSSVERIVEELTGRKREVIFVLVILGVFIAVIYAKMRTLKP